MIADSRASVGLSNVALIPVGVLSSQSLSNAIKAPLASQFECRILQGLGDSETAQSRPDRAQHNHWRFAAANNQSTDQDIVTRANKPARTEISKNRGRGV